MKLIMMLAVLLCLGLSAQAYEPNYKAWTMDNRCTIMYHTEISGNSLAWINWTTLDGAAKGGVKIKMDDEPVRYIVMIVKVDMGL